MPTSRATARNDRAADPCSASCRRAAVRISSVSSARTRARAPVAAVMPASCPMSRAMTSFESSALDIGPVRREQCGDGSESSALGTEERSMGKHVVVGAGGVGGGVARELAAAGHEVVVVSRSGRAPAVDGVRAEALDATDASALTAVPRGADALYNCANPSNYTKWAKEWPPLAASLLAAATDTGAGLVVMGNLYGYGAVDAPIRAGDPLAATGPLGQLRVQMWED